MTDSSLAASRVETGQIETALEIQRLRFNAEDLKSMELELLLKSKNEPDSNRQMALELLRLEAARTADLFNSAALRLSLKASLAWEEPK